MAEKKRSSHSHHPPPPRRKSSTKSATSDWTKQTSTITTEDMKDHSKVRSSRSSRSIRDNDKERGKSRERSKSRGRESTANGHLSSNRSKSKSRSKSRTRQSQSSKPTQDKRRKSINNKPKRQTESAPKDSSGTKRSGGAAEFNRRKRSQKFASQASKAIPASVRMISGSHDAQTSADVTNVTSSFALPNPAGKAGGACTAALLEVLYNHHEDGSKRSWVDVLREMRSILQNKGYDQIPQLTSSRMIDVHDSFVITPPSFHSKKNTRRAILIGINYTGQKGELSGCHNDVLNIAKYLREVQKFKKEDITILMDDGKHKNPTRSEIMKAFKKVVKESVDGDVVFCHYSGHGGRVEDDNGDEDDGYDETLIPVDFHKAGQIRDDDLLKVLVHPMKAGVTMTCLMDCCHSGTVLDLPYRFRMDGDIDEMEMNDKVNFTDELWATAGGLAVTVAATAAAAAVATPAPEMMILGGGPNAIHEYSDTDCCIVS